MRDDDRDARAHSDGDGVVGDALLDCCSALERNLDGVDDDEPRHAALDAVRVHIGRFAAAAVTNNVPPERVIVLLKRSVRELAATRNWLERERDALSHQLVEMMVVAYYATDGVTDERRS